MPKTIPEQLEMLLQVNSPDTPTLGYRQVINVHENPMSNSENTISFKKYDLTNYQWLTLSEVNDRIEQLARYFLSSKVKYGEKVLIFAETRVEWFLSAQALWKIGATVTTLFANLADKGIVECINETGVSFVITTQDLAQKLLLLADQCPTIRHVCVITDKQNNNENFLDISGNESKWKFDTFEQALITGKQIDKDEFPRTKPQPNDVAVVLYTSGMFP